MDVAMNCHICGVSKAGKHHIRPRSEGGADEKRNIVYLCREHHDILEGATWEDIQIYRSTWRKQHQPLDHKIARGYAPDGRLVEYDEAKKELRIWTPIPGGLRSDPYSGAFTQMEV